MFLCMRIVYLWYTSCQMWNDKKNKKSDKTKTRRRKEGGIDKSAESKKNEEAGRKKNEEKGMKKRRSRNTANFILSHPGF